MTKYQELFRPNSIIGMIHLAGRNPGEKMTRAVAEMDIYHSALVSGAIIEDYHGSADDVRNALKYTKSFREAGLRIGINVLRNPFSGFQLARASGAQFVQLDSVQFDSDLRLQEYKDLRAKYPEIVVLGGVRFKYQPATGRSLEEDIEDARSLCDAIVTTGAGTGIETPIKKLADFRRLIPGDFPLIVGAGVTAKNIREQLKYADSAIIGSAFKPNGNTHEMVDSALVTEIMNLSIPF